LENIEADIRHAIPSVTVLTHLEPLNDPTSWDDTSLDRRETLPLESQAENPQRSSDGDVPLLKK
jgi:hypothetical protein